MSKPKKKPSRAPKNTDATCAIDMSPPDVPVAGVLEVKPRSKPGRPSRFSGYVAVGVDTNGESHTGSDTRSAEWAVGDLYGRFDIDDQIDGAVTILPASVRVFLVYDNSPEAASVSLAS